MNFLEPLAFAFAATLPVVVVFYLLKRKRVVKLISSTVLWQRFIAETQASRPFQKLRHNWLLILQLLMLALVILALARPFFAGDTKSSRLRVVILDASASMQSTDVQPSRFEQARAEALKWVDSLRDHDQMVVLQAAAGTVVKQSATSAKPLLRQAIAACAVTDTPTRLNEALRLAETLIKNKEDAEIHLFSDGAVANLAEFENRNLPLIYHRIGERGFNLGIVSLDVRANPENSAQRAIFVGLFNPTTNELTAELELLLDDVAAATQTVLAPPTNTLPVLFLANQSKDGIFTVRLKTPDDLAVDNQASVVSLLPQPVNVLLVTKGNRFLEKALRSTAGVNLTVASLLMAQTPGYDVVVLDDVYPAAWPDANLLAIHVQNTNWFASLAALENPPIVDWRSTHPVLRYVNFDNVLIRETLAVKTPPWGVSLLESKDTPLILAGERNRRRILWLGFDPLQSNWPLIFTYPIFIANAVEWLNPAAVNASQLTIKAGEPFRTSLANPPASAHVILPGGQKVPVAVEKNTAEIVIGDTAKQGTYRLEAGTNRITFCVNLLDSPETATAPRAEIAFGQYARVASTKLKRANLELWRWIAAAGLVVLLFEWWYYHKRTA